MKRHELNYFQQTGSSDPMDSIEEVQIALFAETATNFSLAELEEGAVFTNHEGDMIQLTSYEDDSSDEEKVEDTVRFNLQCISVKQVPIDVESFAYGETFVKAVQDLMNQIANDEQLPDTGEWFQNYYYTNEEDGYRFYTQSDLQCEEDEEQ